MQFSAITVFTTLLAVAASAPLSLQARDASADALAYANAAAQAAASASASVSSQPRQGDATYYSTGNGACGQGSDDQLIVALPVAYGTGYCGKTIDVNRGGAKVSVTVMDLCEACADGDLDMSPAAFQKIAQTSEGRVTVDWVFTS